MRDVDRGRVDAAGRVVERAVEQLHAVELRRVADAVDAVEDRVDLELVGLDFLGRQGAGVGGLVGQALDFQQQRRRLR